jgi:hypothetical protein
MRTKSLIGATVAAVALAAVPAAAQAKAPSAAPDRAAHTDATKTTAVAAAGCTSAGPTVTDYRGVRFATRNCHNYRGGTTSLFGINTGYLYAGNNWFVCQQRAGENPPVGNARNNIWLYTQGDVSYNSTYHAWGWFPATYVSGGVNYGPIPGLRWC